MSEQPVRKVTHKLIYNNVICGYKLDNGAAVHVSVLAQDIRNGSVAVSNGNVCRNNGRFRPFKRLPAVILHTEQDCVDLLDHAPNYNNI